LCGALYIKDLIALFIITIETKFENTSLFYALGGKAVSFLALANASAKKIQAKNPMQPYFRVASAQLLVRKLIN
jgi:hypothetical protein